MNMDELRAHGLRVTHTRSSILEVLETAESPLTAEDIAQRLGDEVSLATTYRTLATFTAHGILLQTTSTDGVSSYSLPHAPHHHKLRCTRCDRTVMIEACPLSEFEDRIARDSGFRITGHNLELQGICPDCQESCCGHDHAGVES